MPTDQGKAGRFQCPQCGTSYRWRPKWAGQSVKCKCTQVMICPQDDPAIAERATTDPGDGLYELADADGRQAAKPAPSVAAKGQTAPSPVVPTLAYRTPEKSADGSSSAFPNKVVDLWMPVWLIAGSTLVEVVAAMISPRNLPGMTGRALAGIGSQMIVGTALMLGGIFLAARLRGFQLGPLGSAVLKLAAISVAPSAAMTLLGPFFGIFLFIGVIANWGLGFVLYFTLLGALFDLDQSDTWYCVMVIFLVKVSFVLAIMWGPLGFLR